ncbi:MAG: class I SAM-dependent methyltransferase [Lachnospiraceae bacterium]|nr:class I SAM-dependent methyltransferase [Lachnospiraceae bacterium]
MDVKENFSGRAADYTTGRPGYAKELIDCFYNEYGITDTSVIADIGSGTGKFAKHLLQRGSVVYCVEPNDDMRQTAEKELNICNGFRSVQGDAENTTLSDHSVDFITTAQAFHWFDAEKFRWECMRILRDNGKVFLIWNVRDIEDLINRELFSTFALYCPDFHGFSGGITKDDPRIKDFFRGQYEYVQFDQPLRLDYETYIARCLSGSYSIKENDKEYDHYKTSLDDIFNKYSDQGMVTIGNHSVAYIGSM